MNKYAQDKMFISRKSQNVKFDRSKINTQLSIYLFHTISCILTKINLPFRKNFILHFKFSPFFGKPFPTYNISLFKSSLSITFPFLLNYTTAQGGGGGWCSYSNPSLNISTKFVLCSVGRCCKQRTQAIPQALPQAIPPSGQL